MSACACAVVLAACGSSSLIGNDNAGSASDQTAVIGQDQDSFALLENRTGQTVMLKSATILPLPGFRTPILAHVAVERLTGRGGAVAGADRGWPPSVPILPLAGYRLPSGSTRAGRSAVIVIGVVPLTAGEYGVAGVNLTVQENGSPATVHVIGPLGLCVSERSQPNPCPHALLDRVLRASNTFVGS